MKNRLTQLNGKTVDKIFQVDFNKDRDEDFYLPWLFFVTFTNFDKYLEIEGDIDGHHIRINFSDITKLDKKLEEHHLPDEPDLWRVYETNKNETLGNLLNQKIEFIEFGMDKDEFEINGTKMKGQKDVLNFITFICEKHTLTIFEGSATGLAISSDRDVLLNFEGTFDTYDTKE